MLTVGNIFNPKEYRELETKTNKETKKRNLCIQLSIEYIKYVLDGYYFYPMD